MKRLEWLRGRKWHCRRGLLGVLSVYWGCPFTSSLGNGAFNGNTWIILQVYPRAWRHSGLTPREIYRMRGRVWLVHWSQSEEMGLHGWPVLSDFVRAKDGWILAMDQSGSAMFTCPSSNCRRSTRGHGTGESTRRRVSVKCHKVQRSKSRLQVRGVPPFTCSPCLDAGGTRGSIMRSRNFTQENGEETKHTVPGGLEITLDEAENVDVFVGLGMMNWACLRDSKWLDEFLLPISTNVSS